MYIGTNSPIPRKTDSSRSRFCLNVDWMYAFTGWAEETTFFTVCTILIEVCRAIIEHLWGLMVGALWLDEPYGWTSLMVGRALWLTTYGWTSLMVGRALWLDEPYGWTSLMVGRALWLDEPYG